MKLDTQLIIAQWKKGSGDSVLLLPSTCEKLMGDQVHTNKYVFHSQNIWMISTGHS